MSWWDRQLKTYFKAAVAVNESTLADGDVLSYDSSIPAWTNITSLAPATYSPVYTGEGTLTYTSVSTTRARWAQLGKLVWLDLQASGTTAGAGLAIHVSLPVTPAATQLSYLVKIRDAGSGFYAVGVGRITVANGMEFYNITVTNWSTGTARLITCGLIYEAA